MNMHKNARLTPLGREHLVKAVVNGQTPEAAARAARVCPRTVRKWVARYRSEGLAGLTDRSSRPHRLYRPTPAAMVALIEALRRQRWTGKQIAAEVAKNPNGIGYVGLAYINTPGVKVIPVNGAAPDSADYPLARPLYYLINKGEALSSIANDFIGFSMSPEGQAIVNRVHFLSIY